MLTLVQRTIAQATRRHGSNLRAKQLSSSVWFLKRAMCATPTAVGHSGGDVDVASLLAVALGLCADPMLRTHVLLQATI